MGNDRSPERLRRRVLRLFAPYRRQLAVLTLTILCSSALGVAAPLLTKVAFDHALFPPGGHPRIGLLGVLVALMIAAIFLAGVLGIVQTYLATLVGQRVMQDLRDELYRHLQKMSLRFFTTTRTGEIQSRIANDVNGIGTVVTDATTTILANAIFVVSSIVAMAFLSWQLTLVSLLVVPAFVYLSIRVGRVRRRIAATTQETLAEMTVITQETLSISGILLAKVFDRQRQSLEQYQAESRRLTELRLRQQMAGRAAIGVAQAFILITPPLVYLAAGVVLSGGAGKISAGTVVAFTALQARLFTPARDLMMTSIDMQSSGALFERIFQYFDLPHEIVDAPGARSLDRNRVRGAVALRDVYFRYDPQGTGSNGDDAGGWTLRGADLAIEAGQLAAIVGPTGAGKTTITYLIARLYDVSSGGVLIDGVDVRELKLSSLADAIGMVTQETFLFHASVRENLRYARPDASLAEMEAAARAAFIHDRILQLPDGYDTVVGERGFRLSGGEKQRLAIARVVLKDPRILILDEATSALDTASERLVQEALEPLIEGRTTVAIAHRLSTILAADVIFVLDRGHVVERGSHADLLTRGGLYARLYEQQFQSGRLEARREGGVVLTSGDVLNLDAEPA